MGVAKRVCKIERWTVQSVRKRNGNIRMARPKQAAKGIAVIIVGTAIHPRKKSKVTVRHFDKKRSRCILMEQAWDERDASLVFITRRLPIGQRKKLNNCLKHLCLPKSKRLSLTRYSLSSAIKKPNLSDYTCRSRYSLLSRLESDMGTFTRTCPSACRPCT